MRKTIYTRLVIDKINQYLDTDDVIVLHGARQVGKTSIMLYLADNLKKNGGQVHFIDLEDSRYVRILDAGVQDFMHHIEEEGLNLKKRVCVFIDEIQYLANPSSFIKLVADHHKNIKLIVSGSSSFGIRNKFKDSLAGRTVEFEIFNLCFEEFLSFKEYPHTRKSLLNPSEKKLDELKKLFREYVLYGGYPKVVLTPSASAKEKYLQQIIDTYLKKDIRDLAAIRDIGKFNKLLEALAAQSGQLLNVTELANTCRIARQTVENYLTILEHTYVIRLIRPFYRNLRSELSK
ncbi:MAG: ATP-binding protein, partial [Candidatus Wallbacteria bacterium]|nr:ATP-binding protein [Candidatus Wallbacteria bacterium]